MQVDIHLQPDTYVEVRMLYAIHMLPRYTRQAFREASNGLVQRPAPRAARCERH
jgi:hypothetical protein